MCKESHDNNRIRSRIDSKSIEVGMSGLPRTGGEGGSEREIDASLCGGGRQRLLVSWEHCNNNNSTVCVCACVRERKGEWMS